MKISLWCVVVVTLISFSSSQIFSYSYQAETASQNTWVNLPSAPLAIKEAPNHRVMLLRNVSLGRIVQYRLGCVITRDHKFKVIYNEASEQIDLSPYDPALDTSEYSIFSLPDNLLSVCKEKLAKIAIVQVNFADGSEWRIDGVRYPHSTPRIKKSSEGQPITRHYVIGAMRPPRW